NRQALTSSHLRAVASAFQKSGSCKCSGRARSCSALYPSLGWRSFTFHDRYRYPPFSAASLIACWTLFTRLHCQGPLQDRELLSIEDDPAGGPVRLLACSVASNNSLFHAARPF